MGIPKLGATAGGTLGLAVAVVGGGINHVRKRTGDVSSRSAQLKLCAYCLVLVTCKQSLAVVVSVLGCQ